MAGPLKRTKSQRLAADPARHVWVAASAGTGKTHVLADRFLRLMLAGVAPERILALTFTKAGAAEMQNRILGRLADWAGMADDRLLAEMAALGATGESAGGADGKDAGGADGKSAPGPKTAALLARARALFALALDLPAGLAIHTIHSFAGGLLASFPLEAGLVPGFTALSERDGRLLQQRALAETIEAAIAEGDEHFLEDLAELAIARGEGGLRSAIAVLLGHEEEILSFRDAAGLARAVEGWFGVAPGEEKGVRLLAALRPGAFDEGPARAFAERLRSWGAAKKLEDADAIAAWLDGDGAARLATFAALAATVTTKDGAPRKFAAGEKKAPGIGAAAAALADQLDDLLDIDRAIEAAATAARALVVGHRIVHRYRLLKRAASAVDFNDMIAATVRLLGPEGMPGYVGWKLDSRFDHVLVDEAQDTNEAQWRIIGRLVEDFWSGANERGRRLFVVGDYKQAIYGFQGTDPEVFESWHQRLAPGARAVGAPIEDVDLDLSFRSGPAVLDVVNAFLDHVGGEALGMRTKPRHHRPNRRDAAGEVVLWPVVTAGEEGEEEGSDGSEESSEEGKEESSRLMAGLLAEQVARWLTPGADRLYLAARGRFARPDDILILLRERGSLMGRIVAALHDRGVGVVGVDRLLLMEPLAVLDCVALVRFAVQPEDDLNLATLLVSPFLGWTHEQVFALAGGRPNLWAELGKAAAREDSAAQQARAWLRAVLALADRVGPYAFLDTILSGPLEGRRRLVARLGTQANDPLDELLEQALLFEERNPPALAGFLAWIELEGVVAKRDVEATTGQVRLKTIHGAKGLEAPIVILADCATEKRGGRGGDGFVEATLPGVGRLPLFHPPKKEGTAKRILALQEERDRRRREEEHRLLYVALTRASDQLYIGGAAARRPKEGGERAAPRHWHELLADVLQEVPGVERIEDPLWGGDVLRLRRGAQGAPAHAEEVRLGPADAAHPGHDLDLSAAPPERQPTRPLAPSADPEEPPEGPPGEALRRAARRGTLTHGLFQRLPALPPDQRAAHGRRWLEAQGVEEQGADGGAAILAEVLRVMDDPELRAVFAAGALVEAPIAGLIGEGNEGADQGLGDGDPDSGARAILGVVDRLLVEEKRVLVVDFKTGRRVPATAADVPRPHRRQMAAYVAVLQRAFPGKKVEAALLYTAGPRLLVLGQEDLAGDAGMFLHEGPDFPR